MHDPLAVLPGYTLRRAANAMMADLSARLAPLELRVTDASVLILIDAQSGSTASGIGRILDIQRANMVPLLNRLESAGLVRRVPIDRKSFSLELTPEGASRLAKARAIMARFETDLLDRIPREHRSHLVPALNALWQP